MKLVAITQRVGIEPKYDERRDMLDQRWARLLASCGFAMLPVPNDPEVALELLKEASPAALVFSGGNDLVAYGGDAPERDATEERLLDHAMQRGLPLLAVCRGLQFLLHAFGNPLERVAGHVASRHTVSGNLGRFETNSYHGWGTATARAPLVVDARADDGTIEAVHHESARIRGVMWHPERETPFLERDKRFIQEFIGA
jgi:N5-(cytidine 5'-diphosphoramidyl)-L-glutamine hydrolase